MVRLQPSNDKDGKGRQTREQYSQALLISGNDSFHVIRTGAWLTVMAVHILGSEVNQYSIAILAQTRKDKKRRHTSIQTFKLRQAYKTLIRSITTTGSEQLIKREELVPFIISVLVKIPAYQ